MALRVLHILWMTHGDLSKWSCESDGYYFLLSADLFCYVTVKTEFATTLYAFYKG